MESFGRDIRQTLRLVRFQPGMAGVVLLTLGLALGAVTAIFSVVNAVLLRPLPYQNPDALVMVEGNFLQLKMERIGASPPEFKDYRERTTSFEYLAAFNHVDFNLSGADPERLSGARVSAELFPLLGAQPLVGETFSEQDQQPGGEKKVVLSFGYCQRRFGGAREAIGQTMVLDDAPYRVVGVMGRGFQFPYPNMPSAAPADVWVPLALTDEQQQDRGRYSLRVIARLRADATLDGAQAEMNVIASELEQQYASSYRGPKGEDGGWRVTVVPLRDEIVGDVGATLLILFCAVGFVVLIACANIANLSLAHVNRRRREIAVRMALGAGRLRIVRQVLTESLVLSVLGGAVGFVCALGGITLLLSLAPSDLPRLGEVDFDARVLGFAFVASLTTGLISGFASAFQASRSDPSPALKDGGQGTTGAGRGWLRGLLVVTEVALAIVLAVGAGLLVKSLVRIARVDPGFDAQNVLTMQIALPRSRYPEPYQQKQFFRTVLDRIAAVPGVESTAAVSMLPLGGPGMNGPVSIEGRPFDTSKPTFANYRTASPNYLKVLGARLRSGRLVAESSGDGATEVVVNKTLARDFFPDEDALGQRVKLGAPTAPRPWLTIVGVVDDVANQSIGEPARPEMYVSFLQEPTSSMAVAVRTTGDPRAMVHAVRGAVLAVDASQPVYDIQTLEERFSDSIARRRFSALLLAIFALAALALSAVGIYGVVSYTVAQRRREIGVRMALGAQPGQVLRLVLVQGGRLVVVGLGLGGVGAIVLTRFLESQLYTVSPTDPWTFFGAVAILGGVALCATIVPALQAARVDPVVAINVE